MMKSVLSLLSLSLLFAIPAKADQVPSFSAFSKGDELFVTILADDCNSYGGSLDVEESCKNDRLTRELVSVCAVELRVMQTLMACPSLKEVPRVLTLSLKDNNVASESRQLKLSYQGQTIDVNLGK